MLIKEMERRKDKLYFEGIIYMKEDFRKVGRLMISSYTRSENSGKTRYNISLKD